MLKHFHEMCYISRLKQFFFDNWLCFIPSPSLWCVASVYFPLKLLLSTLKSINFMLPSILAILHFIYSLRKIW